MYIYSTGTNIFMVARIAKFYPCIIEMKELALRSPRISLLSP